MSGTSVAPPTAEQVYRWNADTFGEGVAANYALIMGEEIAELVEVITDWDTGQATIGETVPKLRTELGDVAVTLLCLAGREGDGEAVERAVVGTSTLPRGVAYPRPADQLVVAGGQVLRAVLKREQGIRAEHDWSAVLRRAVAGAARMLRRVAEHHGQDLAEVVAERWATVSTRDATGPRAEPLHQLADVAAELGVDLDDGDRCAACDAGIIDGHTCGATFVDRGTPEQPDVAREPDPTALADHAVTRIMRRLIRIVGMDPDDPELVTDAEQLCSRIEEMLRAARTEAATFGAERDGARSNLASVAEQLGMPRPARDEAWGATAQAIERQARLIATQHAAQRADEARWAAELTTVQGQLSDLRIAVQNAVGCLPGDEIEYLGHVPSQRDAVEALEHINTQMRDRLRADGLRADDDEGVMTLFERLRTDREGLRYAVTSKREESRWIREQATDLGFEPGETEMIETILRRMFDALRAQAGGASDEVSLAQHVVDALATPADDGVSAREIASRAGRRIAQLHGQVDGMRDQLCRAVGLPLISDDGPDARWARAVELARDQRPKSAQAAEDRATVVAMAEHLGLPSSSPATSLIGAVGEMTAAAPGPEFERALQGLRQQERLPGVSDAGVLVEVAARLRRTTEQGPGGLRVGQRVAALIPDGQGRRVRWPGTVAQFGPSSAAHGLLAIPDGGVRVVLDAPQDGRSTSAPPDAVEGHYTFGPRALAEGALGNIEMLDGVRGDGQGSNGG